MSKYKFSPGRSATSSVLPNGGDVSRSKQDSTDVLFDGQTTNVSSSVVTTQAVKLFVRR